MKDDPLSSKQCAERLKALADEDRLRIVQVLRGGPLNVGEIDNMFKVNTLGVVYAIEAVLPEMLLRGRGHLAAISSLGSYKGLPGESGYATLRSGDGRTAERVGWGTVGG